MPHFKCAIYVASIYNTNYPHQGGLSDFVAPVGEGADLTRQYLWDFKTWEVCMFVQNRQIDLCQHLVHLERQTPNLSAKGAFMV